jgi:uracil-DNA glycosylase family 4
MIEASDSAPGRDCPRCPRLVAFRAEQRMRHPDWHNAPVESFGPIGARLLIVGLAPGLQGANRTGRPFTGDYAGELLYDTLLEFGLAQGHYAAHPGDGLILVDCRITNAVRCVPPQNKPTTDEIAACRPFLTEEMRAMAALKAVLALGRIAHDSVVAARSLKRARHVFGHGASHDLCDGLRLFDSYHCSRYNTHTGRLTVDMFKQVFSRIAAHIAC